MRGKAIIPSPPSDPWDRLALEFHLDQEDVSRLRMTFSFQGCCGDPEWVDWEGVRFFLERRIG